MSGPPTTHSPRPRRRVRCIVSDPGGRLRPGMTGEARIACGERRSLAILGRKLVRLLRVEFW